MPHIPKVCPVVRGWKVSQCTVKKWEPLHDSLDLASPTTESVKPSVLGAVTHEDTQNEHIPHDPRGKHPHSLENWLHRGTGLAWEWLAVCYICHSTCWVCEAVLQCGWQRVPPQLPWHSPRGGRRAGRICWNTVTVHDSVSPQKVPPCCLCAGRDHLQHSCPARFCLNCCLPGHYFRECLERAYWNKHCNRCDMQGHYADVSTALGTGTGPALVRGCQKLSLQWLQALHDTLILHSACL